MGENICKWRNQKGVNLLNIQSAHAVQYPKSKQPNQKMSGRYKYTFHKRRRTDDQQKYGRMLNITNYQRNTNKNCNEVPPHTVQNEHHQKIHRQ